jgi:hypothetical protein
MTPGDREKFKVDHDLSGHAPVIMTPLDGSQVILRTELVDHSGPKPRGSGRYVHLGMTRQIRCDYSLCCQTLNENTTGQRRYLRRHRQPFPGERSKLTRTIAWCWEEVQRAGCDARRAAMAAFTQELAKGIASPRLRIPTIVTTRSDGS